MPRINEYDVGDRVELELRFYNDDGALTDPTTTVAKVQNGNGTTTTYTYPDDAALARVSAGVFQLALTLDVPGMWTYKAIGTGAVEQTEERQFRVRTPRIA